MENKSNHDNILRHIRYLNKLINADFDNRLSECGLTSQQGRILFFVYCKTNNAGEIVHQNDIENEFHLSKSTVSGLVKRMEKKEFIKIEKQHPYAVVKPTDKGEEIITHLRKKRESAIERILAGIDKKDRECFLKTLNKMISNLEGGEK